MKCPRCRGTGEVDKVIKLPKMSDEEFMTYLRALPAYHHMDFDVELSRMDAWLLAHPGRIKNRQFIVNWLNRNDAPIKLKREIAKNSITAEIMKLEAPTEEQWEKNKEAAKKAMAQLTQRWGRR